MRHTPIEQIESKSEPRLSVMERFNVAGKILKFDEIDKRYQALNKKDQVQIDQALALSSKVKDDQLLEEIFEELKKLMIAKLSCPPEWFNDYNLHQISEARIKQLKAEESEEEEIDPNAPSPAKKYKN